MLPFVLYNLQPQIQWLLHVMHVIIVYQALVDRFKVLCIWTKSIPVTVTIKTNYLNC